MLMRMIILLKGEIRYGNTSLYDAFTGAAGKLEGKYREFFLNTAEEIKKKKGKYVRFVGKMDANVWDIKITTTYYCYFVKMKSKTKKGKLYVPIRNTLSIGVEYSNKKY